MDSQKHYITEITSSDLQEMAEAANMVAGEGIKLVREGGKIVVSIDWDQVLAYLATY